MLHVSGVQGQQGAECQDQAQLCHKGSLIKEHMGSLECIRRLDTGQRCQSRAYNTSKAVQPNQGSP